MVVSSSSFLLKLMLPVLVLLSGQHAGGRGCGGGEQQWEGGKLLVALSPLLTPAFSRLEVGGHFSEAPIRVSWQSDASREGFNFVS